MVLANVAYETFVMLGMRLVMLNRRDVVRNRTLLPLLLAAHGQSGGCFFLLATISTVFAILWPEITGIDGPMRYAIGFLVYINFLVFCAGVG